MRTLTHRRTLLAFVAASMLLASACGSDDTASDTTDDSAMDDSAMNDSAMNMDDSAMNMGDPSATPADEVAAAALARGSFALLETRPQGYDDTAGTAVIARHAAGTTVTIELAGLKPDTDFISHLHAQACADDNGGPHYQFEVGGSEMPPNEIHLAFRSDADGSGFMTVENHQIAGLDAVAIVVHPQELIDNKIACADFVEDEAGAAASAIEAGTSHGENDGDMDDMDESMDTDS